MGLPTSRSRGKKMFSQGINLAGLVHFFAFDIKKKQNLQLNYSGGYQSLSGRSEFKKVHSNVALLFAN